MVIVESPNKCRHIKEILGKDYLVLASFGHVRDLPQKELGIDINNNFEPSYVPVKKQSSPLTHIKKAAGEADTVFLAADPDREGEAIAWHIYESLSQASKKKCQRITFSEITSSGIKSGLQSPRGIDMGLVNAQQARRLLDRLAGFKISPMLWKRIRGRTGLSAGRVQSAALKLLYDRDKDIREFKSEEYYTIHGIFTSCKGALETKLIELNGDEMEIKKEKEAQGVVQLVSGSRFRLDGVEEKPVFRKPPEPFETTTLLQEASRLLRFPAERTTKLAQELFEDGYITYIRTDSTRIAPEAQIEARNYIVNTYGPEYLAKTPPGGKQGAQDAHEAIRPTTVSEVGTQLDGDKLKLYMLIFSRFIASQMASAEYLEVKADIRGVKETKRLFGTKKTQSLFRVKKQIPTFSGFRAVYQDSKEEPADVTIRTLKELAKGINNPTVTEDEIFFSRHETEGPKPFTEALLIRELDKLGIGRPSTYASILKTLKDRDYAQVIERKYLVITDLGQEVIQVLEKVFPLIVDYKFTARMEKDLDLVEVGKIDWKEILKGFNREIERAQN